MNSRLLTTRWQQLPRDVVRQLQVAKLRRYLRDVVVPFSAHYREMFQKRGLSAESFRSVRDLEQLPFTSKVDLANTPENPQRTKDFVLIPDQRVLTRRPSTVLRAILHGREFVKRQFEVEFRPIFMTSTTGRSADPVPFLYTQHDLDVLSITGERIMQVCGARTDFRLVNMFPYAPHLA